MPGVKVNIDETAGVRPLGTYLMGRTWIRRERGYIYTPFLRFPCLLPCFPDLLQRVSRAFLGSPAGASVIIQSTPTYKRPATGVANKWRQISLGFQGGNIRRKIEGHKAERREGRCSQFESISFAVVPISSRSKPQFGLNLP